MSRIKFNSFIAAAVLLLAACSNEKKSVSAEPLVILQTVSNDNTARMTTYPGRTRAGEEAKVSFRVAGTVERVLVDEGQHVRRGQVIARLDSRDYMVQLSAVEAEYTQVKAEAERVMALYADSATTANNYDKARYGLQQITQKLQHCRDQMDDCVLRAPFDGYVLTVMHDEHENVSAGMPVISLLGDGNTEVVINIPAAENLRRDKFASFSAHFDLLPGTDFPLQLLSIAPQANVNQLYEVRLLMEGSHPQITPGMSAIVRLTYSTEGEHMINVPLSAVKRLGDAATVFVYDKGKVHTTPVQLGSLHSNGTVDVTSGLKAGDQIVISGIHTLSNGQAVRPAPQPSKTNVGGLL